MNPSCKAPPQSPATPAAASFTISFAGDCLPGSIRSSTIATAIPPRRICWIGLFFESQELELGFRLRRSIESNRWVLENPTGLKLARSLDRASQRLQTYPCLSSSLDLLYELTLSIKLQDFHQLQENSEVHVVLQDGKYLSRRAEHESNATFGEAVQLGKKSPLGFNAKNSGTVNPIPVDLHSESAVTTYLLPMDRSAASSSEPQRNSTGNITSVALSHWDVKLADVMSGVSFVTKEWKMILDSVHQYNVVYRLLWVHRIVEQLRKEFKSKDDMVNLVELLLGFEDRTWKNSEEELQYILTMDTFTTFCKRPDHATWPNLVLKGRCLDLLKDVLRFQLVNALPTIFWVDKRLEIFLLVGSQHVQEVQALFQQLTVTYNEHLSLTNSKQAPIRLYDLSAHYISKQTMDLAFGPFYVPGDALHVLEGIINSTPYTGLGLAVLPAPIQEYLQLLWQKEVHYSNVLCQRQPMSQNVLKLGLPWMSCSRCRQAKEVGTLFGLRSTEANARFVPMLRLRMEDILSRIEFYRHAFNMMKVVINLKRTLEQTPVVCCQRQIGGARGV